MLIFGGPVLQIATLAQPEAPSVVGELDLRPFMTSTEGMHDIAVAEEIAVIGLAADGAALVDVADPTGLSIVSVMNAARPNWVVKAVGIAPPMAVIASADQRDTSRSRLARIDIVDPSSPTQIDSLDLEGEIQDLAVSGRYAFVITSSHDGGTQSEIAPAALHVIDLIRWDGLVEVGSVSLADAEPIAVATTPDLALLLDWRGGVHVISTSNVQRPALVGFVDTGAAGWSSIAASGSQAFIASSSGLHIVNFSRISRPAVVGNLPNLAYRAGIVSSGSWVYCAAGADGLHTVDVTNPRNPVPAGYTGRSLHADEAAISGDFVAVVDKSVNPDGPPTSVIHILDLAPQGSVTGFETMIPPGPVNGIKLGGSLLAMSAEVGSISVRCVLRLVELGAGISDQDEYEIPLCPFTSGSSIEIDFEGPVLAVLDSERIAVHLITTDNDAGPREVGAWPVGRNCTAIAVAGDRLFASDLVGNGAEIEVVDISNPASPTHLETIPIDGGVCVDMAADGSLLAVATLSNKSQAQGVDLHVVDIGTSRVRNTLRGVAQTAAVSLGIDDSVIFLRRSNAAESELLFADLELRWPVLRELPLTGGPNATFDVSDGHVAWAGGSTGLSVTRVEHCVTPARDGSDFGRPGYTP